MGDVVAFWLCKILLHRPTGKPIRIAELTEKSQQTVYARIINGELAGLPNGDIAEPIEGFPTEALAQEARNKKLVDEPREDWRVIMTVGSTGSVPS